MQKYIFECIFAFGLSYLFLYKLINFKKSCQIRPKFHNQPPINLLKYFITLEKKESKGKNHGVNQVPAKNIKLYLSLQCGPEKWRQKSNFNTNWTFIKKLRTRSSLTRKTRLLRWNWTKMNNFSLKTNNNFKTESLSHYKQR